MNYIIRFSLRITSATQSTVLTGNNISLMVIRIKDKALREIVK